MYAGSLPPLARLICMPGRLKVFRTNAGFYDAYIAAPSRLAALSASGAKGDLFAREAAEEVTDPALTAEPLAHPGEVIRKPRGSFAPVPASEPAKPPAKAPSRSALDKAEANLSAFEKASAAELAELRQHEEELKHRRAEMEACHHAERQKLVIRRDQEREKYQAAGRNGGGTTLQQSD